MTSSPASERRQREPFALLRSSGDVDVQPAVATGSRAGGGHGVHLPTPLSSFVGREADLHALIRAMIGSRLVTVCGPGGMGKSRLALEAARRHATHRWPSELRPSSEDEVWMVELAAVTDPTLVPEVLVTRLLGRPADGSEDPLELIDELAERRALIVLDNCEHVAAACAAVVSRLLRVSPNLRVLATSRQPLGITGERVWWLQPLSVPGPADVDIAALEDNEAVQLFVERATDVGPGFALDLEVAPAVGEICRRVDGIPLAIELAAARTTILSPSEIVDRLENRFQLLAGGNPAIDPRHRSLLAVFEWSHDLLAENEAAFLRRLSIFAGGWSLRAAEDVCSGAGVAHEDVLDLLGALVAKSFVGAGRRDGRTRYWMLETTREFARWKLDAAGETGALLASHAQWFVTEAETAADDDDIAAQASWVDRLEEEHDNFRAALSWARQDGDAELALRLCTALSWFWEVRSHLREGMEWLEWALSAGDSAGSARPPADLRAQAMRDAGRFRYLLGDHETARDLVRRSLTLFQQSGDDHDGGDCMCHDVLELCLDPMHALPLMEQQVARLGEADDPNRLAHALNNLGWGRFFGGDTAGARECFAKVLALRQMGADAESADGALFGLARVALLCGEYDAVETPLREVLRRAERTGDADGRSGALCLLGELARARGDVKRARSLLADALALAQDAGFALSTARAELFLAGVEYTDGELEAARVLYVQALARSEDGAPHPYHQIRCTLGLAAVAAAGGDRVAAASLYADAQDRARASGDDHGLATAYAGQADLARAVGDVDAAVRLRHMAIELEEQVGDLPAITRSLEELAALAELGGAAEKAARVFGAAAALRQRHGFARPAPHQPRSDTDVSRARRALTTEQWQKAWAQGSALSLRDVLAYIRKGRGDRRRPSSGLGSLTPAERDVVALVVQGLTNAEVGERLFISRRTVQHHLGHVYAKLGVPGRRELARMAVPGGVEAGLQ